MHIGAWKDVEGKAVTEAGAGGVTIRVLMGDNVGAPNFTTCAISRWPRAATRRSTPTRGSTRCSSSRGRGR